MRFDVGQPHLLHHVEDALAPRAGIEIGMGAQHLVDLAADRHHRIERRHRLLEDHRHGGGAQLPQAAVAGGEQFLADQLDAAAGRHQRALLQQAHHRQRGHRLARAAFADQAQRLALADLQRDAVDDARRRGFLPRLRRRGLFDRSRTTKRHLAAMDCFACAALTCRPPAASCADRARRARRRRSD